MLTFRTNQRKLLPTRFPEVPLSLRPLIALCCALAFAAPLPAQVRLNEVMSAGSDRVLRWDANGMARLGFGPAWHEPAYSDAGWSSGSGPFGFGTFVNVAPSPTIGTSTATQMQYLTPTLYLRKSFSVSAGNAGRTDALEFTVQYNDGFVAYLNGVEVARRNAWAPGQFLYHDQPAANGSPGHGELSTNPAVRTETISLGTAASRLVTGTNVLAVHALNHWESSTSLSAAHASVAVNNVDNFYFKGDLRIGGPAPLTLVANNTAWKYFPGVAEPSGGVLDAAQLLSARRQVPWGAPAFSDVSWASGATPIGAGTAPSGTTIATNVGGQLVGVTPSLYARITFTATAGDLADPLPLQLLMGFDDGFVAYINGLEVARANLGPQNSFVPHSAVATAANASPQSYVTHTLDPPARLLKAGLNVLAVQLHNVSIADADLFLRAILRTNSLGTNRQLVGASSTWRYLIGTDEPQAEASEEFDDFPEGPDASPDWVELHNPGASAASLAGWSLSDDANDPRKWNFPVSASLPAGGHLMVLCDELDITAPATNGYLHANFKLDGDGETVVLTDPSGVSQTVVVPGLTPHHSWARDAGGNWVYQESPSPGAANAGTAHAARVATPVITPPGGMFATAQNLVLACATPGATIRYTTDGGEPSETSAAYASPVPVAAGTTVRARAYKAGALPSPVAAATFLIESNAGRRNLAALSLSGDLEYSLYRAMGVMSITGGSHVANTYTNTAMRDLWIPGTGSLPLASINTSAYNIPYYRGRFNERPVGFELFNNGGGSNLNFQAGLRVSGSGHARPRYKLASQNGATPLAGTWSSSSTEKPSFNAYFRADLAGRPLDFPVFPGQPVTKFESLRLRAGKNDISNPFIRDEHVRRLFVDMGQVGSRGIINTLYVNGVYKGYYNTTAHLKEGFFQQSHGSDLPFDVIQVTAVSSGDNLALQEMATFVRQNSMATLANYEAMAERLDLVNFADYLVLNLFTGTGDWPHNNFVTARERSTTGKFRFYTWDAEGVYGSFTVHAAWNPFTPAGANATAQGVVRGSAVSGDGLNHIIRILYTRLADSPEFRLLFADRVQKHMFDDGALTPARFLARWNELKADMANVGVTVSDTDNNNAPYWVNGKGDGLTWTTHTAANRPSRQRVLLQGYRDGNNGNATVPGLYVTEGLWPSTRAPAFSVAAGPVPAGTLVAITHTNATGTIYFTTDGRDPRAAGGAVQGGAYTTPVSIGLTTTLRARVRNGTEWSPLMERLYTVAGTPPLLVTEIMYNPPDVGAVSGTEFEFIEIKNTGLQSVALGGMSLSNAVSHVFPLGTVLPAGGFAVVARNPPRFAEKYPAVPVLPDGYGPSASLGNGGEDLALVDAAGQIVFRVDYSDKAPWPEAADGDGYSLVPVNPNANPAPNAAASWRASAQPGGSPGADDPEPGLQVRINELLSNPPSGQSDWIELYNPGPASVDVGHWWLSDSPANPRKYRIPPSTLIPSGGYLLIAGEQFNTGTNAFSFSSTGDEAVLSAGDSGGNLTGYAHQVSFGAVESGRTVGWFLNSQNREFFPAQVSATPGGPNAGPRVGPVVISELMAEPLPGNDEYVELRNLSGQPVELFDNSGPPRPWRLDGVDFTFPSAVTLQPRQVVLVVPIDPATFRSRYGIPAPIRIFGPYAGGLNNAGERIAIQKPGKAYTNALSQIVVPYIELDTVAYDDAAPWPAVGGNGASLERVNPLAFGDDPVNWRAAAGGSPGTPGASSLAAWTTHFFPAAEQANPAVSGALADPDGDGLPNLAEWGLGLLPTVADYTPPQPEWVVDSGQTYLGLTQRRSTHAAGLGFFADTASAAHDWSLGSGVAVGVPVPLEDGSELVTWRDIVPADGAATNRLLRLRITSP